MKVFTLISIQLTAQQMKTSGFDTIIFPPNFFQKAKPGTMASNSRAQILRTHEHWIDGGLHESLKYLFS
jgi:hypothetical protein